MELMWARIVLVIFTYFSLVCANGMNVGYYTNKWMVHVPYGEVAAREVARSHNMTYEGPEPPFMGYHYMVQNNLPSKLMKPNDDITNSLKSHELVSTAFQDAVEPWSYRSIINQPHDVLKNLPIKNN